MSHLEKLEALSRDLAFFGRVQVQFKRLRWWPGDSAEGFDVAFINPSGALVLCAVWDGAKVAIPARNVRPEETVELIAEEVVRRVFRAQKAA